MTGDKVKWVCDLYIATLHGFPAARIDEHALRSSSERRPRGAAAYSRPRAGHIRWMAEETKRLVDAGRLEKAFRWLGFMQGWLWAEGFFSIDELKTHNMPQGEEFQR